MRALVKYESELRAYVDGRVAFDVVETAVRHDLRVYADRRAARWSRCPGLVDDVAQVMLTTLWRSLDAYDGSSDRIAPWCGARMEYAMRRFFRTHRRDNRVELDDVVLDEAVSEWGEFERVEIIAALRNVADEGVRAYALATLDAGLDVVSRLACDGELVARLGWSDVAAESYAARRRARRDMVLREAIGGA